MDEQNPKTSEDVNSKTTTQDDFEQRRNDFLKEYGDIVMKYDVDILNVPTYIPNNKDGTWSLMMQAQIVDRRTLLSPSPFITPDGASNYGDPLVG